MSPLIRLNDTSTDMCKHVYNLCYTFVSVETEGFPSTLPPVNRPNMMPPNQMQVPRGPGINPPPHLMNSTSEFLIALILSIYTCTCIFVKVHVCIMCNASYIAVECLVCVRTCTVCSLW